MLVNSSSWWLGVCSLVFVGEAHIYLFSPPHTHPSICVFEGLTMFWQEFAGDFIMCGIIAVLTAMSKQES